ncbi:hypothetical protein GALL_520640 [mine drainage metagenome]|uniref:Uncharacterized protein n=1 Tax=mine drainage metagenome TaxID=410659 RepID=A0A1J5P599_9ZZZZ
MQTILYAMMHFTYQGITILSFRDKALLLLFFKVGNVGQRTNKIGYYTFIILYCGNCEMLRINLTIFTFVPNLPLI